MRKIRISLLSSRSEWHYLLSRLGPLYPSPEAARILRPVSRPEERPATDPEQKRFQPPPTIGSVETTRKTRSKRMTLRIVLHRFDHIFGTLYRLFEQRIGKKRLPVAKEAEILSSGSSLAEGGFAAQHRPAPRDRKHRAPCRRQSFCVNAILDGPDPRSER